MYYVDWFVLWFSLSTGLISHKKCCFKNLQPWPYFGNSLCFSTTYPRNLSNDLRLGSLGNIKIISKLGEHCLMPSFPSSKKSKKKNPTYQSIYICFGLNTVKETFMLEKLLVTGFCICKVGSSLSPEQYWVFRHTAVLIIFGKVYQNNTDAEFCS